MDIKLCHGVVTTNMPGAEKTKTGHAWLEFMQEKTKVALDTTWMIIVPSDYYRKKLKAERVIEYSAEEAFNNWKKSDYDNAWDEEIKSYSRYKIDTDQN